MSFQRRSSGRRSRLVARIAGLVVVAATATDALHAHAQIARLLGSLALGVATGVLGNSWKMKVQNIAQRLKHPFLKVKKI